MAQACTIYCVSTERAAVVELAESVFGTVSFVGPRDRWSSLTVRGMAGEMTINSKVYEHHGDDFARLQFSTSMAVDNSECADAGVKKRVVDHVEATELMLGIVATPSLDSDDRYHELVFQTARLMDGLIFDGVEFLDPDGSTLLEVDVP